EARDRERDGGQGAGEEIVGRDQRAEVKAVQLQDRELESLLQRDAVVDVLDERPRRQLLPAVGGRIGIGPFIRERKRPAGREAKDQEEAEIERDEGPRRGGDDVWTLHAVREALCCRRMGR